MKHTKIPDNFIYPNIKDSHFKFGSGQLIGTVLRPDGDWRKFVPTEESQNIRGIESSACYIEGQQHAIATLEEEMFGEKDNNYSARFNALLSYGSEDGGDPLQGADSIRHDGLVPQKVMDFGNDIQSWDDFHSWQGVDETGVRALGKDYLMTRTLGNDIVVTRDLPIASKYTRLKVALRYSPCPVSVTAWFQDDAGNYIKPPNMSDNHLVELVFIDADNCPYIWDTYAPYLKKLSPNYNFDFGMRWSVQKKVLSAPEKQSFLVSLYQQLLAAYTKLRDALWINSLQA